MRIRFGAVAAVILAFAGVAGSTLAGAPHARAAPCSDVEVVFARATDEPVGLGGIGGGFVELLRQKANGKSVGAYAVDYPATGDFAYSMPLGAEDANEHVRSTIANCPDTRIVLGGYSQGAGVIDLITGVNLLGYPLNPLPPEAVDRVAAIAVFGNPSRRFGDGPITLSPGYGAKAVDYCWPLDPVCTKGGGVPLAHGLYFHFGQVAEAADYAAARV